MPSAGVWQGMIALDCLGTRRRGARGERCGRRGAGLEVAGGDHEPGVGVDRDCAVMERR